MNIKLNLEYSKKIQWMRRVSCLINSCLKLTPHLGILIPKLGKKPKSYLKHFI